LRQSAGDGARARPMVAALTVRAARASLASASAPRRAPAASAPASSALPLVAGTTAVATLVDPRRRRARRRAARIADGEPREIRVVEEVVDVARNRRGRRVAVGVVEAGRGDGHRVRWRRPALEPGPSFFGLFPPP